MSRKKELRRTAVYFKEKQRLHSWEEVVVHETESRNVQIMAAGVEIDMGTTEVETYVTIPWHNVDRVVDVVAFTDK